MHSMLILGSYGLLGSTLVSVLKSKGHRVYLQGRTLQAQVCAELTDIQQTNAMLESIRPEIIINLAALTNVDDCEAHPHKAYLAHVRVVENIAAWMRQSPVPCHLIQISTDQVYDGPGPHQENQCTLTNYYAFSKYAGELAAATVPATILRTNFFGRSQCAGRLSITDWLYRSLVQRERIEVFEDVAFSPLSLETLTQLIELVAQRRPTGVFNLGSRNGLSKADFAFAFAEALHLPTDTMKRISSDKAAFLRAYRPKDMRMDCARFEQAMNVQLPSLSEQIKLMKIQYDKQS